MPVLVVGAETAAGRAAVEALLRARGEVRAYADAAVAGDDEAAALRATGAKVAVGDLDDEAHLEAALEQVHTVVHLAGNPFAAPEDQLDAFATTVSAAIGAGCRRLVRVTELAAADPDGNPYLEHLAAEEALLADAPFERVTFRCGLRYARDDAATLRIARAALGDADRQVVHAPLHLADLAEAVRAADRLRDTDPDVDLAVELVGPEETTLGAFHERLRAALDVTADDGRLPPAVEGWLSRPAVGGPAALGRSGTPIADGLRAP
jgi:uncharacterized protein YbjT (DUF2867 family)